MGRFALAFAAAAVLWPLAVPARRGPRAAARLRAALRPGRPSWPVAIGFVLLAALLWRVYDRAMFITPSGAIATGDDHNIGDLPFHLGIIAGFTRRRELSRRSTPSWPARA